MSESLSLPIDRRPVPATGRRWREDAEHLSARFAPFASLALVAGVSLYLNAWHLTKAGYGNTFYAAAVRSMTTSWKNFFFGAVDPGGFITVDKPPVFLWVDALWARVFGYSSLSLLLPSALAGMATVVLLWLIVRRHFGTAAATIAGLVLALTPITVAVDRLNLPEPFYILALLAAAACVLQSLQSRRWVLWTLAAGFLVGVAFNTKMLAGWIPGPAFALAILVGVRGPLKTVWRQWLLRLALLGFATLAISASWGLVVDFWPKSDRPFIGGSTDNSVANLAFGYNGLKRVEGQGGRPFGGPPGGFNNRARPGGQAPGVVPNFNRGGNQLPGAGNNQPAVPNGNGANNQRGTTPGLPRAGNTQPAIPNGNGTNNQRGTTPGLPGAGSTQPAVPNANGTNNQRGTVPGSPGGAGGAGANQRGGFQGPGGIIAGTPGLGRMFDAANGGQIAWLLPYALIAGLLALWRWRKDPIRLAAVVIGLGWVLLFGGVFSYAKGIYHSYYTSALAPGIGLLVAAGTVAAFDLIRRNRAWILGLFAAAGATVWTQLLISGRFTNFYDGLRPVVLVAVLAGLALVAASFVRRIPLQAGLAVVVAALLLIPAAWSNHETANASLNTTLPQAGPRGGAAGRTFGSDAFENGTAQLAAWLESHRDPGSRWDLAVASAMNASDLIARYGLSVMPIGGFSGGDPTITAAEFENLVAKGEIRYVLAQGAFGGGPVPGGAPPGTGQQPPAEATGARAVFSAVQSGCKLVNDPSLPAQYRNSLYDCSSLKP